MKISYTEYIINIINAVDLDREHKCTLFTDIMNGNCYDTLKVYLNALVTSGFIDMVDYKPLEMRYFKVIKRVPPHLTISNIIKNKKLYLRRNKINNILTKDEE